MFGILASLKEVSNKIYNTISYSQGLVDSVGRKTCTGMARVRGVSHDRVNRELKAAAKEKVAVQEALDRGVRAKIKETPGGGALVADHTLADKPYSKKLKSVGYHPTAKGVKKGVALGAIVWTDMQQTTLPVEVHSWRKGDRPKGQVLVEQSIRAAQRLGVHLLLADAFFATKHFFASLLNTGIVGVVRAKSNMAILIEGYEKMSLKDHHAFTFSRNQRSIAHSATWNGFALSIVALKIPQKFGEHIILYFATNGPLEKAKEIASFYLHRWKIEPLFRHVKQVRGLNDCQAHDPEMQDAHFRACFYAYFLEALNKPPVEPQIKPRTKLKPVKRITFRIKLRK